MKHVFRTIVLLFDFITIMCIILMLIIDCSFLDSISGIVIGFTLLLELIYRVYERIEAKREK